MDGWMDKNYKSDWIDGWIGLGCMDWIGWKLVGCLVGWDCLFVYLFGWLVEVLTF